MLANFQLDCEWILSLVQYSGVQKFQKILSQNLQAVADQGCHLEGFCPYKGTAYRGYTVLRSVSGGMELTN
jgi:hypothetical protein